MSKTVRSLVCVAMSLVMLLSANVCTGIITFAEENVVQPRFNYTAYTATSFTDNSQGLVYCTANVEGYDGVTTKIHIKMELQKHNMIKWVTVTTWEGTFYDYFGALSKTKTVSEAALYRVKATYTVYSGSAYETITSYSQDDFITP